MLASIVSSPGLLSTGSIVVAQGLSCSSACGIFPRSRIKPMSPALAGRFFITEPPGKPAKHFNASAPCILRNPPAHFTMRKLRDIPGDPVVKTLYSQRRGHRFNLWLGRILHAAWHGQKKKKKTVRKNSGVRGNWFQVIQVAKGRAGITFCSLAWSHVSHPALTGASLIGPWGGAPGSHFSTVSLPGVNGGRA